MISSPRVDVKLMTSLSEIPSPPPPTPLPPPPCLIRKAAAVATELPWTQPSAGGIMPCPAAAALPI